MKPTQGLSSFLLAAAALPAAVLSTPTMPPTVSPSPSVNWTTPDPFLCGYPRPSCKKGVQPYGYCVHDVRELGEEKGCVKGPCCRQESWNLFCYEPLCNSDLLCWIGLPAYMACRAQVEKQGVDKGCATAECMDRPWNSYCPQDMRCQL